MIRERGIGLFDQLHAMLANYRARAKASRICLSPFHIEILRKERRDRIDAVDAHCHYPQFWRGSFLQVLEGGHHRLVVSVGANHHWQPAKAMRIEMFLRVGARQRAGEGWLDAVGGQPTTGFLAIIHRKRDLDQRIGQRSEEHTSELQSLMRSSYAVFCLKKNT